MHPLKLGIAYAFVDHGHTARIRARGVQCIQHASVITPVIARLDYDEALQLQRTSHLL
jgi:hypothetical protein